MDKWIIAKIPKALSTLCWTGQGLELAEKQYFESKLMTDQARALGLLVQFTDEPAARALDHFLRRWQDDATVMNTFWRTQCAVDRVDTFASVKKLMTHPQFKFSNPNCFYSSLGVFGNNLTQFHKDAERYQFVADRLLEMDRLNPMVAARIAGVFDFCARVKPDLKKQARDILQSLIDQKLSSNTFEIVSKTLSALS
jgi:aminopeptidase N